MKKLVILDYGHGNANSIRRALSDLDVKTFYSNSKADIINSDAIILPGVGHFKTAINSIKDSDIEESLFMKAFSDKVPILGICLGFQLMTKFSEEGNCDGLGWVDGNVNRITPIDRAKFKVPHIGWRTVNNYGCRILKEIDLANDPFYFCHKFSIANTSASNFATFRYEKDYIAAYETENLFGVQFHPEKSSRAGLTLLKNFIDLI